MPTMTFIPWKIPILAKIDPIISGFEIGDGTLLPCLLEFGKKLLSLRIHNVREVFTGVNVSSFLILSGFKDCFPVFVAQKFGNNHSWS